MTSSEGGKKEREVTTHFRPSLHSLLCQVRCAISYLFPPRRFIAHTPSVTSTRASFWMRRIHFRRKKDTGGERRRLRRSRRPLKVYAGRPIHREGRGDERGGGR
jgi:hypothetical protein